MGINLVILAGLGIPIIVAILFKSPPKPEKEPVENVDFLWANIIETVPTQIEVGKGTIRITFQDGTSFDETFTGTIINLWGPRYFLGFGPRDPIVRQPEPYIVQEAKEIAQSKLMEISGRRQHRDPKNPCVVITASDFRVELVSLEEYQKTFYVEQIVGRQKVNHRGAPLPAKFQ